MTIKVISLVRSALTNTQGHDQVCRHSRNYTAIQIYMAVTLFSLKALSKSEALPQDILVQQSFRLLIHWYKSGKAWTGCYSILGELEMICVVYRRCCHRFALEAFRCTQVSMLRSVKGNLLRLCIQSVSVLLRISTVILRFQS